MERIRRFFNQFKKQIFYTIIAVVMGFAILQTFNTLAKKQREKEELSIGESADYEKDYSVITGEYRPESLYKGEVEVLNKFVNFLNEKNYEQAYNMLGDDCKEVLYPNIDVFIQGYCNNYFSTKKTCKFQSWNDTTYQVQIRDDAADSGVYQTTDYLQDYYTVRGEKLYIGGFVKREEIGKEANKSKVLVKVNYIDYYINYTELNFIVTNTSEKKVYIDLKEDERAITIEDKNGINFPSNVSEIAMENLKVNPGEDKTNTLRFEVAYRNELEFTKFKIGKLFKERSGLINIEVEI